VTGEEVVWTEITALVKVLVGEEVATAPEDKGLCFEKSFKNIMPARITMARMMKRKRISFSLL